MTTTLEALRRGAVEHPDDEPAHRVYADALMEQGDPRGELIARMCVDPHFEVPEELWGRLAGALRRYADHLGVERGLLRRVHLRRVTPTAFRHLIGRPEWEGVLTVGFGRGRRQRELPGQEVFDLLTHPVCRLVREVRGLDASSFFRLWGHPLSLDVVGVSELPAWRTQERPLPRLVVRELVVGGGYMAGSTAAALRTEPGRALLERLEVLRLFGQPYEELELLAEAPLGLQRVVGASSEAVREGTRWHLQADPMQPNASRRYVDHALRLLHAALTRAAPRLSRVTLRLPDLAPEDVRALEACAPRVPMTIESTGPIALVPDFPAGDEDAPF